MARPTKDGCRTTLPAPRRTGGSRRADGTGPAQLVMAALPRRDALVHRRKGPSPQVFFDRAALAGDAARGSTQGDHARHGRATSKAGRVRAGYDVRGLTGRALMNWSPSLPAGARALLDPCRLCRGRRRDPGWRARPSRSACDRCDRARQLCGGISGRRRRGVVCPAGAGWPSWKKPRAGDLGPYGPAALGRCGHRGRRLPRLGGRHTEQVIRQQRKTNKTPKKQWNVDERPVRTTPWLATRPQRCDGMSADLLTPGRVQRWRSAPLRSPSRMHVRIVPMRLQMPD